MNTKKEIKFTPPGISTIESSEIYINPKSHAIEFAKWVSNLQVLDDFWSMSKESQEDAYEQFLKSETVSLINATNLKNKRISKQKL